MPRLASFLVFLQMLAAPAYADVPATEAVFQHSADAAELQVLLGATAQELGHAVGLRGDFQQRKYLHELPKPLLSSGQFLVARNLGVIWHTRQPFDSELVLTSAALVQRDAAGNEQRLLASDQPGLGAVVQLFGALFSLDLPRLSERFFIYGDGNPQDWILGLKPRDTALARRIERVVVTGGSQPRRILLEETGGDRTEIVLSHQVLLSSLSDADRERFK